MVRIHVVTPITTAGFSTAEDYKPFVGPETEVSHALIARGPASIECELDEALAAPDTIAAMRAAQADGADAVVIDCMGDPGLAGGREAVDIPVIGAAQASFHLAAMLAHAFSVVTISEGLVPQFENNAAIYGLAGKLRSVRSVDIPVLELDHDTDRVVRALRDESLAAIERDGAHAIVFGCTGMRNCAEGLRAQLVDRGRGDVPVIEPVRAALRIAEAVVGLGLSHSKRTYPAPPPKAIVGYEVEAVS